MDASVVAPGDGLAKPVRFLEPVGLALAGLVLSLAVWRAAWSSDLPHYAWGGSSRVDKSMASLFFHPVNSPIGSGGGMELELAAPGLAAALRASGACVNKRGWCAIVAWSLQG